MDYIKINGVEKTFTKPKSNEVVMALDGVDAEIESGESFLNTYYFYIVHKK